MAPARPMSRRYREKARLTDGHSAGITAVAFSPQGDLLATGGLDGRVCLWHVDSGELLHRYAGNCAVLSLSWKPSHEWSLVFGTKEGNITTLIVNEALSDLSMSGFWAHKYPVEHLAIKGDRVASGAHCELKVWQWRTLEQSHVCEVMLPEPTKTSRNERDEVLVTSLHWTTGSEEQNSLLMVTYMYHGVHFFDTQTWMRIRTIPLPGTIANASLSESGALIAISNAVRGFDVYKIDSEKPFRSFEHEVAFPAPTPVLFIHGGRALVGGSTVGKVNIWDVYMGKLHTLSIPKYTAVLAISGYCRVAKEIADYRFLIATGLYVEDGDSTCIIWEAEAVDSTTGERSSDAPPTGAGINAQHNVINHANVISSLFAVLWSIVCVLLFACAVSFVLPVEDHE